MMFRENVVTFLGYNPDAMTEERRLFLMRELDAYRRTLPKDISNSTPAELEQLRRLMMCAGATCQAVIRELEKVNSPPR